MVNEKANIKVTLNSQAAEKELEGLQKEMKQLIKLRDKAAKEGNVDAYKKLDTNLKKVNRQANKLVRENKNIEATLKNVNGVSFKELTDAKRVLLKRIRDLKQGTKEWKQEMGNLNKVNSQITKVRTQMGTVQTPMQKVTGWAKGLLPAFGFTAIIGGTVAAAKKLYQLADQTLKYRQQVQKLTGATGQALSDLTAKIEASSKTFARGFDEMAVANHNFAESMGISEEQANSLINKGFLAGADASGEFLDRLREYGPQFKAAGLSAEQAIAVMTQEVREGIYSDKGSDTIKEGTLRLREMTSATREALNGIGISSDQLEADLKSGTITYFEAIQMVSNKLGELPAQSSEVGTAIADIFGGPGEDAGLKYIKLLGTVDASMDAMVQGAGETATAQQKLLEANQKLGDAWNELLGNGTGTFTKIKASAKLLLADGIMGVIDGVRGIRDWFIALYNESLPVRAGIQTMFAVWKGGFETFKTVLKTLWNGLKTTGRLIKGILTFDKSEIKAAIQDWANNIKTDVVEGAKNVAETWTDAYNNTVNGRIKPVKQVVEVETRPAGASGATGQAESGVTASGGEEPSGVGAAQMEVIAAQEKFNLLAQQEQEFTQLQYEELEKRNQQNRNWVEAEKQNAEEMAKAHQDLTNAKIEAAGQAINALIQIAGEESAIGKALFVLNQARAVGQIIFNTGIANAKAVAASPLTAGMPWVGINTATAATSIASILAQTISKFSGSKEYATGKYPARPNTGMYDGPHIGLFNEVPGQPELVVDGMTTKRLQLNYPQIIDAIYRVRDGQSPQYEDGKYPRQKSQNITQPYTPQLDQSTAERLATALEKFEKKKLVVYSEKIKRDIEDLNNIENER